MMNNKEIIKSYEQLCGTLRVNANEDIKQQFLILFKELEIQLNKTFDENMSFLSYTAKNLKEEMRRIDSILSLINGRKEFRTKMINDHRKYIGYDPLDLKDIEIFQEVDDFKAYKSNLKIANEIIGRLMKSDKRLNSLKSQIERNPKNADYLQKEMDRVKQYRNEQIEDLKSKNDVLEDLYNYSLTAPFSEDNAYINFILIKLNSKDKVKVDLSSDNKRIVTSRTQKVMTEKKDKIPESKNLGTVKPNNIVKKFSKASKEKTDINIPSNGLVANDKVVQIDVEAIK